MEEQRCSERQILLDAGSAAMARYEKASSGFKRRQLSILDYDTPRKQQIVINQLHAGCCPRISGNTNFDEAVRGEAECPHCGAGKCSTQHYLFDCGEFEEARSRLLPLEARTLGQIFRPEYRKNLLAFVQVTLFNWELAPLAEELERGFNDAVSSVTDSVGSVSDDEDDLQFLLNELGE